MHRCPYTHPCELLIGVHGIGGTPTFDPTADGRAYFKIGKATSIPKRIKQFGPCELIAEARLPSEKESLAFEAQLHQQFAQWRKPETEIFCFTPDQVEQVKAAMTAATNPG